MTYTTGIRVVLIGALIGFAAGTQVLAQGVTSEESLSEHWLIERFDSERNLPEGGRVTVRNEFGNIRTRGTGESTVYVHAVVQRHKDDSLLPVISLDLQGAELQVTVSYPDGSVPEGVPEEALHRRRVDVAVIVPGKAPLRIITRDGLAESKGHKSLLVAETASGKINIVTSGTVNARSEHGNIYATFKNRRWSGPSEFHTGSGGIEIYLIESPDISVDLTTAGSITTDYSIDIRQFPASSHKEATAVIGDGAQQLSLTSVNGNIKIGRLADMRPAVKGLPQSSVEKQKLDYE